MTIKRFKVKIYIALMCGKSRYVKNSDSKMRKKENGLDQSEKINSKIINEKISRTVYQKRLSEWEQITKDLIFWRKHILFIYNKLSNNALRIFI